MRNMRAAGVSSAVFVAVVLAAGCSPETMESAKGDIQRNTETARVELNKVKEKAKPVMDAAKPVTDAVKREADQKWSQLSIGARVTTALKANAQLPQTIRVDADPDSQGVKLRGTVKTSAQSELAERIAKDTLGSNKRVQNDLAVEY